MSDYDIDIVLWSERQAELLRRRAAGDPANETDLDWLNIAEEIESVGSEQRHAVESLLVQAMNHMLKVQAWPLSSAVSHREAEARVLLDQARRRFVPSMRQRIDFSGFYKDAVRGAPRSVDGQPPPLVPADCPWTFDELLHPAPG